MKRKRSASSEASAPTEHPQHRLLEALADYKSTVRFKFTLYVTGNTSRSAKAIINIRAILDQHLAGRHTLEVIDIYQQPAQARRHDILAAPTLIKSEPEPLKRLIGDLANEQKVLIALDLQTFDSA